MSKTHDYTQLVQEYRDREVHVKTRPAVFFLDTIGGCPFNCIICKPRPTKIQRMSSKLLKSIEPYFADTEVILANGGSEPLVDDMNYWVSQSTDNDFVLHLCTNGFLLTEKISQLMLKTRLSIRFSFHAGRPDTYYKIMGIDMKKSVNNIKRLVDMSKHSSRKHDFWLSYCVMKENVDEIEDFLHVAHDCGIHSVRLMRLLPTLRILTGTKLRGMTFRYFEQTGKHVDPIFYPNLPRYKALASELDIKLEFGDKENEDAHFSKTVGTWSNVFINRVFGKGFFPVVPPKAGTCAAPWIGQLGIEMNGDVTMCCASKYYLGNLNESSLDEIWRGPRMTSVRQAFNEGHFPRACGYCQGFGFTDYPNNSFPGIRPN
jgi:radical SAM protein with 4Fe4S-binding SPASM domain